MKEKNLISIVVPIYNVEKYLSRCINSLVNQSYKNIEIILIDDGSIDNCPQICDDWAKKDKRIRVIHKKNAGLGIARNTGIEHAKGKYICFIDSDDMLDLNSIEECCNKIEKFEFDIVYFGFKYIDTENNIKRIFTPTPTKNEYFDDEIKREFLPGIVSLMPDEHDFNMSLSSCMCLIKLDLINENNWRFVSERKIISEDVYSLLVLFKKIKSVYICPKSFYSYRINPKSLTHSYRSDRFEKVKELHNELIKLYNERNMTERFDYMFLSYTISCIKSIVISDLSFKKKKKEINIIINDKKFNDMINLYFERESVIRKIYFIFIKLKFTNIIYFLTKVQNRRSVR